MLHGTPNQWWHGDATADGRGAGAVQATRGTTAAWPAASGSDHGPAAPSRRPATQGVLSVAYLADELDDTQVVLLVARMDSRMGE